MWHNSIFHKLKFEVFLYIPNKRDLIPVKVAWHYWMFRNLSYKMFVCIVNKTDLISINKFWLNLFSALYYRRVTQVWHRIPHEICTRHLWRYNFIIEDRDHYIVISNTLHSTFIPADRSTQVVPSLLLRTRGMCFPREVPNRSYRLRNSDVTEGKNDSNCCFT